MFKVLTDLEGFNIMIKADAITAVQDMGEFRLVLTPFDEFEVRETLSEIFKAPLNNNNLVTFSKN